MKKQSIYAAMVMALVSLGSFSQSSAQVNAGISIGSNGLNDFYLNIGNHYRVPRREVIVIHEERIPDDEIPVVFYIADRAHVSPRKVAAYRRSGCSWMDVTTHFGLGPDIYGRPVVVEGPPYGHAYGYYKHNKHARNNDRVYLSDREIITYSNSRLPAYSRHQDNRYDNRRDDVRYREDDSRYRQDDRSYRQDDRGNRDDGDRGNGRGNGKNHEKHNNGRGRG